MRSKSTLFICILFVGIGILTWLYYISADNSAAGKKDVAILLSQRLNDAVESQLNGPLLVSKAMASDYYVRDFLSREKELASTEAAAEMKHYLKGIQKSNDYVTAFLVSDDTKCYYTDQGLLKIVDPSNNHHDIWYSIFAQSDKDLTLDVDVDEANDKQWTVFVNSRIKDEAGNFLGVCGIGIEISDLQKLFDEYHRSYQVDIRLVNRDGLVQVDTSTINIETTYNSNNNFKESDDYFYVDRGDRGYEVTHYLKDLNWYLVISQTEEMHYKRAFNPMLPIFGALIFLILGLSYYIIFHRQVSPHASDMAMTDLLTGFGTRKNFVTTHGEHGIFQTTRYKVLAVVNIDFFNEAATKSDGDKILIMVAGHLKDTIGKMGNIYRWGFDEFILLLEWSPEFADGLLRQICRNIEKDGRVTISAGLTEVHLSEPIRQNYYRAKQGCYLVKEMGGNGVKMVSRT